jgi:hypothetical protein
MKADEPAEAIVDEAHNFHLRGFEGSTFRVKSYATKLFHRLRLHFGVSGNGAVDIVNLIVPSNSPAFHQSPARIF